LNSSDLEILNEEYFFSKKLFIKTKNTTGMVWAVDGDLSARGTSGTISLSYKDPTGLNLEKLRMKVDSSLCSGNSHFSRRMDGSSDRPRIKQQMISSLLLVSRMVVWSRESPCIPLGSLVLTTLTRRRYQLKAMLISSTALLFKGAFFVNFDSFKLEVNLCVTRIWKRRLTNQSW
jgi:hypothetical protein